MQPAPNPLKLQPDRKFGGVKIYVIPDKTKHFATAQTKHEDQDVGRVERIFILSC
jgi:hypothetical protein